METMASVTNLCLVQTVLESFQIEVAGETAEGTSAEQVLEKSALATHSYLATGKKVCR